MEFVTGLSLAPQSANLTPAQVAYQEARAEREGYIQPLLVAFDQFANVLFVGSPDETISSRAERDAVKHKLLAAVLSTALDIFQRNRGQKAQAGDLQRADSIASTEAQSLTA